MSSKNIDLSRSYAHFCEKYMLIAGSHSFTQCNISVAAANDRRDNPRDRNLACFEESETFLQFIGFTIQLIVG